MSIQTRTSYRPRVRISRGAAAHYRRKVCHDPPSRCQLAKNLKGAMRAGVEYADDCVQAPIGAGWWARYRSQPSGCWLVVAFIKKERCADERARISTPSQKDLE